MHFDRDTIDAQLSVQQILDYYGWETKRGGGKNVQSSRCPRREHGNGRAFVIDLETGIWVCHPCTAGDGEKVSGDKFKLVAEMEHLNVREEFGKVLEAAASIGHIAGDNLPADERARQRAAYAKEREAQREERRKTREAEIAERRRRSIPEATARWEALARSHPRGEAYLSERGVLAALEHGLVRFDERGNPCMPLYTSDGHITNVITRRLPEQAPTKNDRFRPIDGLWARGSFVHPLLDISRTGRPLVVVPEGFFDSLSAALAWPNAVVLGVHGAGELLEVAKYAAEATARAKKTLALVPHRDKAGARPVLDACKHANHVSLSLQSGTLMIVNPHAADLNDAWRTGWRPAA